MHRFPPKQRCGFTLIETLAALALGGVLIAAALQLHQSMQWAHTDLESRLLVAEKLIVLQRVLGNALADAQFPCEAAGGYNLVDSKLFWLEPTTSAASIYQGDSPEQGLRPTGVRPGDRDPASEVLVVRASTFPIAGVEEHNTGTGTLHVTDASGFGRGDIVLVCDEENAALIQITDAGPGDLRYIGGGVRPDNCPSPFTGDACAGGVVFPPGAIVVRYAVFVFYIGVGKSGDTLSLYRQKLVVGNEGVFRRATLRAEELVEGVGPMRVSVIANDGVLLRYANRAAPGRDGLFAAAFDITVTSRAGSLSRTREQHVLTIPPRGAE